MADAPVLEGDAQRAVDHRGSHLQIIAAAGSGKTEVVRPRVCGVTAHGDMDYMPFAGKLANHPIPAYAGTYAREDGRPCE